MYVLIVVIFVLTTLIFGDVNIFNNTIYQANTLKILRNQAIPYSFVDTSGYSKFGSNATVPNRFEASDIIIRPDGRYMYVVFDNTYQIGAFCTSSKYKKDDCTDQLLEWPDESARELNSEFEAIVYNPLRDTYYVAQEVIPTRENPAVFKPVIFEIRITHTKFPTIKILNSCAANLSFTSRSKGFEGLEFVTHQRTGKSYLLALCEANLCASELLPIKEDNNLGNGRFALLEMKAATSSQPCYWSPVDFVNLPTSLLFSDYSAVSIFRRNSFDKLPSYIAVTGQEESQVFIGVIEEIPQAPYFKISTLPKNTVYNMPRIIQSNNEFHIQYCNIEGVTWRGKNQLIIVSDKAKNMQDAACNEKDQSIHYVLLPEHLTD